MLLFHARRIRLPLAYSKMADLNGTAWAYKQMSGSFWHTDEIKRCFCYGNWLTRMHPSVWRARVVQNTKNEYTVFFLADVSASSASWMHIYSLFSQADPSAMQKYSADLQLMAVFLQDAHSATNSCGLHLEKHGLWSQTIQVKRSLLHTMLVVQLTMFCTKSPMHFIL